MIYVIWESDGKNENTLREISLERKCSFLSITDIKTILNKKELVLFIEEDLLEKDFFSKNKAICEKIEKRDWIVILFGHKKKFKPLPYLVKRTRNIIRDPKELNIALDQLEKARLTPNSRENIFNKKMNRLFYIYYCMTDRDSVTFEEIEFVSGISKRTFQRDIQTLKEVLITQKINYNEYEKCYTIEYI
jgi:hypothetical protein